MNNSVLLPNTMQQTRSQYSLAALDHITGLVVNLASLPIDGYPADRHIESYIHVQNKQGIVCRKLADYI